MNLYIIKNTVDEILDKYELDENDFSKLDELKLEANEKLENMAKYIRNLEYEVKALQEEEEHFKLRKQATKKKIENLKNYTSSFLKSIGKDKYSAGNFKYSFRKSKQVEIIDEDKIPEDYKQIVETVKIDKMKLKKDLEGNEIEGVKLIEKQNLQIK